MNPRQHNQKQTAAPHAVNGAPRSKTPTAVLAKRVFSTTSPRRAGRLDALSRTGLAVFFWFALVLRPVLPVFDLPTPACPLDSSSDLEPRHSYTTLPLTMRVKTVSEAQNCGRDSSLRSSPFDSVGLRSVKLGPLFCLPPGPRFPYVSYIML